MRRILLLGAAFSCPLATATQAVDAQRCLDTLSEGRIEVAHSVCRKLEPSEPESALAYAYYQLYGEIGGERLKRIAITGIDKATSQERDTLEGDAVARYSLKEMTDWGIEDWDCRFL